MATELYVIQIADSNQSFTLSLGENSIGSAEDNSIQLSQKGIAEHHALIVVEEKGVWIQDLESENGTYVNGDPIKESVWLKPGDQINFGPTVAAAFESSAPQASVPEQPASEIQAPSRLKSLLSRPRNIVILFFALLAFTVTLGANLPAGGVQAFVTSPGPKVLLDASLMQGGLAHVGQEIVVVISAEDYRSIGRVEFWVGSKRIDAFVNENAAPEELSRFVSSWTPDAPGTYLLIGRAYNSDAQLGESLVWPIEVVPDDVPIAANQGETPTIENPEEAPSAENQPEGTAGEKSEETPAAENSAQAPIAAIPQLTVKTEAGESIQEIANQMAVPVEEIARNNPGIPIQEPQPKGKPIKVPIKNVPEKNNVILVENPLPSIPVGLSAQRSDLCDLIFSWSPGANDAAVYDVSVLMPQSLHFMSLADSPYPSSTHNVQIPYPSPGIWFLRVAAIDAQGQRSFNEIQYDVQDCDVEAGLATDDTLAVTLDLISLNSAAGNFYCYLSINSVAYRVPQAQGQFIGSVAGLPQIQINWPVEQDLPVDLECWTHTGEQAQALDRLSILLERTSWNAGSQTASGAALSMQYVLTVDEAEAKSAISELFPQNIIAPFNLALSDSSNCTTYIAQNDIAYISEKCETQTAPPYITWQWGVSVQDPVVREAYLESIAASKQGQWGFSIEQNVGDSGWQTISRLTPDAYDTNFSIPVAVPYLECKDEVLFRVTLFVASGAGKYPSEAASLIGPRDCDAGGERALPNGCGGAGMTLPTQYRFEPACNIHDVCYFRDVSNKTKVQCDNEFLWDMQKICNSTYFLEVVPCYAAARSAYTAVVVFGHLFHVGESSILECLNAVDVNACLLGYGVKGSFWVGNKLWDGTKWVATRAWDGTKWVTVQAWDGTKWVAVSSWDGTKWVANKTWDGTKWVAAKTWGGISSCFGLC